MPCYLVAVPVTSLRQPLTLRAHTHTHTHTQPRGPTDYRVRGGACRIQPAVPVPVQSQCSPSPSPSPSPSTVQSKYLRVQYLRVQVSKYWRVQYLQFAVCGRGGSHV
eukprot:4612481-Pyramimonas_sp.AAC.1